MAYVPTGFSPEQEEELLLMRRRELELHEKAFAAKAKGKVWSYLSTFASVGMPLLAFFGIKEAFAAKRRRRRR